MLCVDTSKFEILDLQGITKDYAIKELNRLGAWLQFVSEAFKENELPQYQGLKELSEDVLQVAKSIEDLHCKVMSYVRSRAK